MCVCGVYEYHVKIILICRKYISSYEYIRDVCVCGTSKTVRQCIVVCLSLCSYTKTISILTSLPSTQHGQKKALLITE